VHAHSNWLLRKHRQSRRNGNRQFLPLFLITYAHEKLLLANADIKYFMLYCVGQRLELSEDRNTERNQKLLADFEKRKKVNINIMIICNATFIFS
jgi:lantibiotic modifying enzyme